MKERGSGRGRQRGMGDEGRGREGMKGGKDGKRERKREGGTGWAEEGGWEREVV